MDWIKSLCVLDLKLCKTCHESFVAKCPQRKVCTQQKFIFHKNASLTSYNRKTIPYTVVHADRVFCFEDVLQKKKKRKNIV